MYFLKNIKFFFWDDTLQREYSVLKNRLENVVDDNFKSDSERMLTLIGRYSNEFKVELRKLSEFLYSLLKTNKAVKKESINYDNEEFKYTFITNNDKHTFILKAYTALGDKAFISIIFDKTERQFYDMNSLINSLKNLENKIENKKASIKKSVDFNSSLNVFLDYCNNLREKNYTTTVKPHNSEFKWFHKLVPLQGNKFIKIISYDGLFEKDKQVKDSDFTSKSAWAFIEKSTGDVFKPASWSAPAKHARANIYDKASWKNVGAYGPAYMR